MKERNKILFLAIIVIALSAGFYFLGAYTSPEIRDKELKKLEQELKESKKEIKSLRKSRETFIKLSEQANDSAKYYKEKARKKINDAKKSDEDLDKTNAIRHYSVNKLDSFWSGFTPY